MAGEPVHRNLYAVMVSDFEDAWDALAASKEARSRGGFMFLRQAMNVLEWGARVCASDASGSALKDWSRALLGIEPRYFTSLPGVCAQVGELDLPKSPAADPRSQLLSVCFALVRNGRVDEYQQIAVELTDGKRIVLLHSGATWSLSFLRSEGRAKCDHLAYARGADGNLHMLLRPEWLLFDLKDSIQAAGLLSRRDLSLDYLWARQPVQMDGEARSRAAAFCRADSVAVEAALRIGGHAVLGS